MKEECLICEAPLEYLVQDEMMDLPFCHMHGPEHHTHHSCLQPLRPEQPVHRQAVPVFGGES